MLNETKILCFLELAKTLNFSKCGKNLYMSQQGVSQIISSLETDLNTKLFERTKKNVYLTEAGKVYYKLFYELKLNYADLSEYVHQDGTYTKKYSITMGFVNGLYIYPFMKNFIKRIENSRPEVNLVLSKMMPGVLQEVFESGDMDIAINFGMFIKDNSQCEKFLLSKQAVQIIISKDDILYEKAKDDYHVIAARPYLIDKFEGETKEDAINRALKDFQRHNVNPAEVIVLNNRESVYMEAELGRGVFFANSLTQLPEKSNLGRISINSPSEIFCQWQKKPLVEEVINLLKEEVAESIVGFYE